MCHRNNAVNIGMLWIQLDVLALLYNAAAICRMLDPTMPFYKSFPDLFTFFILYLPPCQIGLGLSKQAFLFHVKASVGRLHDRRAFVDLR